MRSTVPAPSGPISKSTPYNPLPIYTETTTLDKPTVQVAPGLDLVAIDYLPSLLPLESSEDFGAQLLPHLLDFGSDVCRGAEKIFRENPRACRARCSSRETTR